MALLDSTPQIGLTTYTYGYNGLYYVGQSIYGQDATIESVQFRLGNTSTPTSGYLQAFIYESLVGDIANVNARPSSTSSYVASSVQRPLPLGLGSAIQNIEFTFPVPYEMEEGKEYVVGLQYIKDTYDQYMSVQVLSTQHPGNYSAQRTDQSNPSVIGTVDLYFELYGELIPDSFTGTKDQLGRARISKVVTSSRQSQSRISKTVNSLQTAISYIVLLFTKSQDSVARVQKAVTSVQDAVSSIRARTVFSSGSYESLPIDDSDLAIPYNSTEVSNVSAEDGVYASQGGSGFILHEYKMYHDFNTATITVKWVGKSTIPCDEEPVYLQIYNYNTESWIAIDSDSTSNAGANFELTGTPSGNNGDYYAPDGFIAVRVYQ